MITNLFERLTLKNRIVLLFAASTLIPFICTAFLSYDAMSSILAGKLESGVRSKLKQVQLSLENTINNLNHVSQQLAYPGSVGKKLDDFLSTNEPFERAGLVEQIRQELNLIRFTNPGIGLTMYYFQDEGTYLFENAAVKRPSFSTELLPQLARYYRITYFGPHISLEQYNDQYVLSAVRKVKLPSRDHVYVYLESGFKLTQNILETDRLESNSFYLMLDNDGRIGYSELPSLFPVNTYFEGKQPENGLLHNHYWFKGTSNQGWSTVTLIPIAEYNKERDIWVVQMRS
jgi:two-component system sensor histidine kinase YesM